MNIPLLDSNRLLNLKQRHGISINTGNSTSIYLVSKKLERELELKLSEFFKCKMDLNIHIEKVLNKINDVEVCFAVLNYVKETQPDIVLQETSKIRSFMTLMKKSIVRDLDDENIDEEILEN